MPSRLSASRRAEGPSCRYYDRERAERLITPRPS